MRGYMQKNGITYILFNKKMELCMLVFPAI